MTKQRLKIKQPKALIGDRVDAVNYRRKPRGCCEGGTWEEGVVVDMEYRVHDFCGKIEGWWKYTVRLNRKTKRKENYFGQEIGNKMIWIYVGDEDIKLLKN